MCDIRKFSRILLVILLVLLTLVIIVADINYYNHVFLNKINEATPLILGLILICAILLVEISIKRWMKYLINTVLTGMLLICLFFFFLEKDLCNEEILLESENTQHQLLMVQNNCGATTSYEYKVLLSGKDSFLRKERVIFKSYAYPIPTDVKFLSDNSIQIVSRSVSHTQDFVVLFDEETLNTDKTFEFYNGKQY